MIISETNKKVFIHIPKTGGTSIANYLKEVWPDAKEYMGHTQIGQHSTFTELQIPEDYTTYAFVRNPWARMVSLYTNSILGNRSTIDNKKDFEGFVRHPYRGKHFFKMLQPQTNFIGPNTNIGRFENLEGYVRYFFNSDVPFYHLNKSNHDFYQDYYTEETKMLVRNMFLSDIATFGYSF